ncbi:peptidylprolyl isomerase [Sphingomonas sp.]|uniref:peptidylprolyl isomerase n=1 Tax=Sphingomonas sp. TaxID=28214 RepID=UPI0025E89B58|nr:peptidylprolyl isomerase [Sphingomonas sp.]
MPAPPRWLGSLAEPNARRSLILCTIGLVAGLLIAGFGLFTAEGTRVSGVAPENVATVNGVPILMSDYALQLRAVYDLPLDGATPAQKRRVLDDMIREELYVQRGIELGMQTDTIEVRQALVGSVEAMAASDAASAQPGEKELQAFFAANPEKFADEGMMTLDEYILPTGADGARAVADLRVAGTQPAVLARHRLKRSGRMTDGEEFYFAAKIHLGERLFEIARKLDTGHVSDPVALPDGTHILVMRSNSRPPAPDFAKVRDRVRSDYIAAQKATLIAGNERFLRKRADIQIQRGYQ